MVVQAAEQVVEQAAQKVELNIPEEVRERALAALARQTEAAERRAKEQQAARDAKWRDERISDHVETAAWLAEHLSLTAEGPEDEYPVRVGKVAFFRPEMAAGGRSYSTAAVRCALDVCTWETVRAAVYDLESLGYLITAADMAGPWCYQCKHEREMVEEAHRQQEAHLSRTLRAEDEETPAEEPPPFTVQRRAGLLEVSDGTWLRASAVVAVTGSGLGFGRDTQGRPFRSQASLGLSGECASYPSPASVEELLTALAAAAAEHAVSEA